MGHWTTLRSQLQHPALDQDDQTFRSQFQMVHNRTPQQDDVPTWHHIILTEDILTHRPLTWPEYQAAARQHMLRPLASTTRADPQMTNSRESTSPSPPTHTPLSSPPCPVAPSATTEPEQTHRTSVTTSPCLTDKRRSRSSDDRSIVQQQHKEQQIATKKKKRRKERKTKS